MKNNERTVIFYAPFGVGISASKNGGAESGGRRNLSILQMAGYDVIPVSKAVNSGNLLKYAFDNFKNVCVLNKMFMANPGGIFHISGMYDKLLPYELFVIKLARRHCFRIVYDIRNGDFVSLYNAKGWAYRSMVSKLASSVDLFLCQGREFEIFIKSHYSTKAVYFPNFVMDSFIPEKNPKRGSDDILLVYTGRVVEDKNIGFLIDIVKYLKDRFVNACLEIVGGYDKSYYDELCRQIDDAGVASNVAFRGRLDQAGLADALTKAHFFLFPSKESREGHSNSLTEAMTYGVVPIASPAGFTRDVVGNSQCIVDEMNPDMYAERIIEIWNGDWEKMSEEMRERVLLNYTQTIVSETLLTAYAAL